MSHSAFLHPLTALFNLCFPASFLHSTSPLSLSFCLFPPLHYRHFCCHDLFFLIHQHFSLPTYFLLSHNYFSASQVFPFPLLLCPIKTLQHFIKASLCISFMFHSRVITGKGWWLTYNYLSCCCCCVSVLYLQNSIPSWLPPLLLLLLLHLPCLFFCLFFCLFSLFIPSSFPLFPGCSGSDLPLYGEAASDHGPDGVLSGGHQGERPQWFPPGQRHYKQVDFSTGSFTFPPFSFPR